MADKESVGYIVDVKILDVEKRYKPGPKHYVYIIQVTWANPSNIFIIYRRYTQFFDLQCKLLDMFVETSSESNSNTQTRLIPFLPGKIILGRSQIRQIALERKQALDEYCQALIALPEYISRSRPILDFLHPLPSDVQKLTESGEEEKKPVDKSSLVISGPAKLATYRCLADFKATEKTEMSLKRNDIVQVLQKHPNGWWFAQFGDQTGFVPGSYLEPSELKRGAREGKTIEKSINETYVVNTTYEGKGKDELSLEQGSFVTVIEKSLTGWWKVKFHEKTGQYPAVYLTSCDGRRTPENVLDDRPNNFSRKPIPKNTNDSDSDEEEEYRTDASKSIKPEIYYANRDFDDKVGDCLSFKRGDIIEIHNKNSNGWWFGRRVNGAATLSCVPPTHLQKEPIVGTNTKSNVNTQFASSKSQSKSFDNGLNSVDTKQQKEKVSTPTIRKFFDKSSSTNKVDHSKVIKQPEITTAQKGSPITTSTEFRPINNKQEPMNTSKTSSITTPIPLRPINDKPASTTDQKKIPVLNSTSNVFRPVNNKQETTTTVKTSSVTTTSTAFRPVNSKPAAVTTTAPKSSPVITSTPVRPTNTKQEPSQKSVKNLVGKYNAK